MTNLVNQNPYLKTSREFPEELNLLSVEVNRSYLDIANTVNDRIIGIHAVNKSAITGESWFLDAKGRQQTLRKVFDITAFGTYAHGIPSESIDFFTKIEGIGFNGTTWFPIPYVGILSATNQIGITADRTNFSVSAGAGSPPTITRALIILEWLSFK